MWFEISTNFDDHFVEMWDSIEPLKFPKDLKEVEASFVNEGKHIVECLACKEIEVVVEWYQFLSTMNGVPKMIDLFFMCQCASTLNLV